MKLNINYYNNILFYYYYLFYSINYYNNILFYLLNLLFTMSRFLNECKMQEPVTFDPPKSIRLINLAEAQQSLNDFIKETIIDSAFLRFKLMYR